MSSSDTTPAAPTAPQPTRSRTHYLYLAVIVARLVYFTALGLWSL